MTAEATSENAHLTQSWDSYWRGTGGIGAWSAGGVTHPAIKEFWEDCFRRLLVALEKPSMLDIASGNGALIEWALGIFRETPLAITCVDLSEAAISNIRKRFPGVRGLVSDASSIPLESKSFDIVTSQFGVEYAGPGAISEAARLVAPGGYLVLLMHSVSGSIYMESAANLDAIARLRDSRFIPLALDMFRAGFAAVRGGDRAPYDAAAQLLQPAVEAADRIIAEHGEDVAGGSVAQFYSDVARIHGKLPNYDPDEVIGWLARLDTEMTDYASRMEAMKNAAMDEADFRRVCSELHDTGFSLEVAAPFLASGDDRSLGWVLVAVAGDNGSLDP
jgi:ubiquinone/menaquinone biosynthesis C-methylase UbiE